MSKKVLYSVTGVVVLGFLLLLIIGLNTPQSIKQAQGNVPTQNPVAVATSSAVSSSAAKQKVAATLSASIDHYVALLSAGKATLGLIQYSSALEGTAALSDPNSSASKISAFRNNNCLQNDPTVNLTTSYRNSSNVYYDVGLDSSAIDDWYSDMSEASSNICIWANNAVSWEIKGVSTEKLSADEAVVVANLAQARKDITRLK